MDDKLRDLTPIDINYVPGERPTDEKLEGAETQTKEAIEYIEATIGDAFGESLQTNLSFTSNITRDIGDRSLLNPILTPSVSIFSYLQSLTLGKMEHELDLIPTGTGSTIVSSSADTSVVPGQFKNTIEELVIPGDWTILSGLSENAVNKNSRKLITHSPSNGGSITFAEVTSGRGSAYEGARNNTIPSIAQAETGGDFLSVFLSDAINNIYTILLPLESKVVDRVYGNSNASLSNTEASVGSGQQLKLPLWLFDPAGLDMGANATAGGPKLFPLNTIQIYDWSEKKIVDGLVEVKASNIAGSREYEIICTFRSDIILNTLTGQYILATSGSSISESIGALQRDLYFHTHMGDDMIRGIKHSDLYDLRTGTVTASDRTAYYGPSNIDNNHHSMYLHRDGYTSSDTGAGGNVMRGSLIIGNTNTGAAGDHENFNLLADSYTIGFGEMVNGGRLYFDKVRVQNLPAGHGAIPQNFSDTALVIEGALDDSSGTIKTVYTDGNFRVGGNTVLGTSASNDVLIPGDLYIDGTINAPGEIALGATETEGLMVHQNFLTEGDTTLGASALNSVLILGDIQINGAVNAPGGVTLGPTETNALTVHGNLSTDDNLTVLNSATLGTTTTDNVDIAGTVDIGSTLTLAPRTTSGLSPAAGMTIFDSSSNALTFYNGSAWVNTTPTPIPPVQDPTVQFFQGSFPEATLTETGSGVKIFEFTNLVLNRNYRITLILDLYASAIKAGHDHALPVIVINNDPVFSTVGFSYYQSFVPLNLKRTNVMTESIIFNSGNNPNIVIWGFIFITGTVSVSSPSAGFFSLGPAAPAITIEQLPFHQPVSSFT